LKIELQEYPLRIFIAGKCDGSMDLCDELISFQVSAVSYQLLNHEDARARRGTKVFAAKTLRLEGAQSFFSQGLQGRT
jgi:hypothetical protein